MPHAHILCGWIAMQYLPIIEYRNKLTLKLFADVINLKIVH